jgi:hypothetical protein
MTHAPGRKPMPRQNLKRLALRICEFEQRYNPHPDSVEHSAMVQMAALRRVTLEQEKDLATNWTNTCNETSFQDLVISMIALQFRVAMGMKFSGDDWLDIMHDAVVKALTTISRMKVYDHGGLESSISLAVIEAQRRHLTRMSRSLNGPNRPAKTRAAAHLSRLDIDAADARDIHNIAMRSGISHSDIVQMQGWLVTEDTDILPDVSDNGSCLAQIENSLDIDRVRAMIPRALDARSADIIQKRYLADPVHDRSALAEKWDLTETRIGQLERAACADLRKAIEEHPIQNGLEFKALPKSIEAPILRTVLKPRHEQADTTDAAYLNEIAPPRRTREEMEAALDRMRTRSKARGRAFSMEHFASFQGGQY